METIKSLCSDEPVTFIFLKCGNACEKIDLEPKSARDSPVPCRELSFLRWLRILDDIYTEVDT